MSYYPNQYPNGAPGYSPYGQQYPHRPPPPAPFVQPMPVGISSYSYSSLPPSGS
ncbi:hypothetical protein NECAME_05193 [Necator americanus]|uniref:Uncharacterized protein n=1 Tax=Necator americanus TaxID=51031 RepID=W2SL57_NECAM|nr:hypothetical protein NECAME_05193 [Necator americanus]ETN69611.1 hypothetical protein NECAME_05193 [Necator americanus]